MLKNISIFIILFAIYSILGWIMEMIAVYPKNNKFENRGFLLGPWCPIYGTGTILLITLLEKYKQDVFLLIIMSIIICSILEYFTSYILEKIFKARWWDYSNKKFNICGRVCLTNAIAFGLLGFVVVKVITPFFMKIINTFSSTVIYLIAAIIFIIMTIDFIYSCKGMIEFKGVDLKVRKDNTAEIAEKVKKELMRKSFIYKIIVKIRNKER